MLVGKQYLKPSDKEAIRSQLGKRFSAILQQSEYPPHYVQERYGPVHGNVGKQEHERYLAGDCPYDVESLQLHKLVALEAQVFLQSGHICIV